MACAAVVPPSLGHTLRGCYPEAQEQIHAGEHGEHGDHEEHKEGRTETTEVPMLGSNAAPIQELAAFNQNEVPRVGDCVKLFISKHYICSKLGT